MNSIAEHKRVPLTDKSSGYYMTDVEKVVTVAFALETRNINAIHDVTGIKKHSVRWIMQALEVMDWDIEAVLNAQCSDRCDNLTENREIYPILSMKGVKS